MHSTTVRLKDGRVFCGSIWVWRPLDGYFTLTDDETGDLLRFELKECASVIQKSGRRTAATVGQDDDMLEKARKDGWDEASSI